MKTPEQWLAEMQAAGDQTQPAATLKLIAAIQEDARREERVFYTLEEAANAGIIIEVPSEQQPP